MELPSSGSALFSRGYGIGLLSAAVLSTTAIFIRHLTLAYHVPPLVLAFWRDVFVVGTLLPVMKWFSPALLKIPRNHRFFSIGYGFCLAVFNTLWTVSVARNGAAIATVLVYSSAAFTALLGRLWLAENLAPAKVLAIALSFGGCTFISGAVEEGIGDVDIAGILTGVLSGLAYAFYSLMGRSAGRRGVNGWTSLLHTFGWGAAFLFVFNQLGWRFIPGHPNGPGPLFWLGNAWNGWIILFILAAGPTIIGFGLLNLSLTRLPASHVNLLLTIEPVFTAAVAYFLLGERLTTVQIGGGLLVFAGILLLRIREGDVRPCASLNQRVHVPFSPVPNLLSRRPKPPPQC